MKRYAITSRAIAEPMKNCKYSQFSVKAVAGTEMIVTELTSVATNDRHAAHRGTLRLPRKNSRVSVCLFSIHAPTATIETRSTAVTARSGHDRSDPENQSGIFVARLAPKGVLDFSFLGGSAVFSGRV